ncbi:MAG: tyrosine--tRNA ligase [Spirochaetota bacterium]
MTIEQEVERQFLAITEQADEVVPEAELREKLHRSIASGTPLRVKYGIDPTNPSIHIGHLVPCRLIRTFQELGHRAVLIVGDYTAQIGDPTGRNKERPGLTQEEVTANMERYIDQLSVVVDVSQAEVHYQSEWFGSASLAKVLTVLSRFSVAQMLAHETFRSRIEAGTRLSLHELAYPVLQAEDSVQVTADVEIGGTDQRFNCLCGRDLQRASGLDPQVVITVPLLPGTDGAKMSKSMDNHISVELPATEIVGRVMSLADEWIPLYARLAVGWPRAKREQFITRIEAGALHPRDAKLELARAIAEELHGTQAAAKAVEEFERVFSRRDAPSEIAALAVNGTRRAVVEVLQEVGFAASKSEGRRLIAQGGVRIDGVRVEHVEAVINLTREGTLVQVGKRRFVRVSARG